MTIYLAPAADPRSELELRIIRLAQVLQTTPDEILGAHATAAAEEVPVIDRRRLKYVDKLSRHQKRLLLGTIDAFLSKVT